VGVQSNDGERTRYQVMAKRETLLQSQRRKLAEQRSAKAAAESAQRPTDTDENRNRVRVITNRMIGVRDPDIVMNQLLEVLEKSDAPIPGKLYVYKYVAITPGIRYDRNPVVQIRNVSENGWVGQNFHWLGKGQSIRNYLASEIISDGIYEIYPSELRDVMTLPIRDFKIGG